MQVNAHATQKQGLKVHIQGVVQGVGFRPFVYNLAIAHHLTGWVRNTSQGVEIQANGDPKNLAAFLQAIQSQHPPLARIDHLASEAIEPTDHRSFTILTSQPQPGDFVPISPDISICEDCRRELFDPSDRRFRYPFINCTNCGPRFTIIQDIPYDRPLTTMANFPMCPDCQREYDDPANRRFHAQPVACPVCGPRLVFHSQNSKPMYQEDALQIARQWLKEGKILAVKGLGGFHLACDAANPQAVEELRRRKRRSQKPFAVMAFDLATIEKYCQVSTAERKLLSSPQHPLVLLDSRPDASLSSAIAPHQNTLGFLLPYTPLHFLLLEPSPGFPEVLVMTSGNLSEEPIAYEDEDALNRLSNLADGFLFHNRPIHIRTDDSVMRIFAGEPYFIRRSRGYAPDAIPLPRTTPPLLAVGAELKNTFCLARDRYGFLSHYIGDMENYETYRSFEEGIHHFEHLFHTQPRAIVCDLHPEYLATRYARQRAEQENLPLISIQHHHAHLTACLADNSWETDDPVIGLSFDGTGYGSDGAIWGGEILFGGYTGFERALHFKYVPLPGGDTSIRKPARMALAHLWAANLPWEPSLPPVQSLCAEEQSALKAQLEHRLNAPLTSSMGRLFDAVSALIGICQTATYEGQAAIEMEAVVDPDETGFYPLPLANGIIDPVGLLSALLQDYLAGISIPRLAARFHNSIARLALDACQTLRSTYGCHTVALSGGVWQNKVLLTKALQELKRAGFNVLIHRQLPPNDGCIAIGQVMAAIHQMK